MSEDMYISEDITYVRKEEKILEEGDSIFMFQKWCYVLRGIKKDIMSLVLLTRGINNIKTWTRAVRF